MAEVYQAAYAAAFYAQQQQLQNLMRMQQQVPGLMHQNLAAQQLQQFSGLDGGMAGGDNGGYGSRMSGRDDRSRVGRTMGRIVRAIEAIEMGVAHSRSRFGCAI